MSDERKIGWAVKELRASGQEVKNPIESLLPRDDACALNNGAIHCFHCGRNWPPDETWDAA